MVFRIRFLIFLLILVIVTSFFVSKIVFIYLLHLQNVISIFQNQVVENGSYINERNWLNYVNYSLSTSYNKENEPNSCHMYNCFEHSICQSDFKVYVYPSTTNERIVSPTYSKILSTLHNSKFITTDPHRACIFIPNFDTLDRDPLSPNFDLSTAEKLVNLPYWNSLPNRNFAFMARSLSFRPGQNHLLFNLYTGTWPYYHEDEYMLSLNYSILAKASLSTTHFRPKFDISLPLIHPKHPAETYFNFSDPNQNWKNPIYLRAFSTRPYLLSFKGKRYLTGIGSSSRNALYHLHNGKDIIMLTTCRHGMDWERNADKRCPLDLAEYDKYDYKELMYNSTFCLIPRGRRLGSYRFLEAIQVGCIPVLLSNDLELPFSEVIDWRQAVIWADERLLFLLPLVLRRLPTYKIIQYKQRLGFLWNEYFSSVESIVLTTLEIIRDRISTRARSYAVWNSLPGALKYPQFYFLNECDMVRPVFPLHCQSQFRAGFTLLIPIRKELCSIYLSRFEVFRKTLFLSPSIIKVLVVWQCNDIPLSIDKMSLYFKSFVEIVLPDERHDLPDSSALPSPNARFQPINEIPSFGVFTFTLDLNLTVEQLEFAYLTWQEFPNRLVGFEAHSHYFNHTSQLWHYSDSLTNGSFSIIQLNAAFYHRDYHRLYWIYISHKLHEIVNVFSACDDILFNCLVGDLSHLGPIKLFTFKQIQSIKWPINLPVNNNNNTDPVPRSESVCVHSFSQHFTKKYAFTDYNVQQLSKFYLPLYYTSISFNPSDS